jgi:uncharacterized protein YjbI with pentapeptide repeats
MKIANPKLPTNLIPVEDFSSLAQEHRSEDTPITGILCGDLSFREEDLISLEVRGSRFQNCSFTHCHFEKAVFVDVVFQNCDLSNSRFRGAFFERCQFLSCKAIGVDMSDTRIKHVAFRQTKLLYTFFDKSKISDVLFDEIDFTESSMIEASFKNFTVRDVKFIRNNFFKTPLCGVDLSRCDLVAPVVSMPPFELKGAIISPAQAADLIGLWGIVVKSD